MCFVWIWEQTAIISLYSINWLVCITETECVYWAVRTGSLYIILRSAHTVYLCVLCGSENKQRLFPYTALTDWSFITEVQSVCCAVRTGSLKKIQGKFTLQNLTRTIMWTTEQNTEMHADSSSSIRHISLFYTSPMFSTIFTKACHSSLLRESSLTQPFRYD